MNKQLLIGNLGKDPELKNVGESQLCKLTVATTERVIRQGVWENETTWHDVVCWGKTAEACCRYLGKGSKVYVEGRTQKRKWESDSGTRIFVEVVADKIEFLDKKRDLNSGSSGGNKASGQQQLPAYDDDIPF